MILGSFYLRQLHNGNLHGEFCNNTLRTSSTESADRTEVTFERNFEGEYHSTWFEDGAEHYLLKISPKERTATVFTLLWRNTDANVVFRGEGFIMSDNILIGNYWDEEVQGAIGNRLRQP